MPNALSPLVIFILIALLIFGGFGFGTTFDLFGFLVQG